VRWKFLLKPGWLALTLAVFAFAGCCFTLLAPWQFQRDADREAQNAALQSSFVAEPAPWTPTPGPEWSRTVVTGTYLPQAEVIARLRTVQGEPAFEILTPLRTTSGDVVLVDRGSVAPDDRTRVPPYAAPPAGEVTIVARNRADETDPRNRDAFADESTDGRLHSYSVDSRVVARSSGMLIHSGYLQLDSDQPGVLSPLPLPKLEAGPFFSYALQWIAFGVMALFGWGYFTIRELKPGGALTRERTRRKSVAEMLAEDEVTTAS